MPRYTLRRDPNPNTEHYQVHRDGRRVGTIYRTVTSEFWLWAVNAFVPPEMNEAGYCDTLDEAKAALRAKVGGFAGRLDDPKVWVPEPPEWKMI